MRQTTKEITGTNQKTETVEGMPKTGMRTSLSNKGFTLIELIVMLIILSILAAVAVQKYSDISGATADTSAKDLLAALRTANELVYTKQQLAGTSMAYTMGDLIASVDNLHLEHINYSNHDMKVHVRIGGQEYWYTMSSPATGMPSISEWKHDQW
jgi:prepilin-type N-terminal cleavage/methylation domain-containing protein